MPDIARGELRLALSGSGCAICARIAYDRRRFIFWFLIEQYGTGPWISLLRRSHGFCPTHWADLVDSGASYSLSYVAEYLGTWFWLRLTDLARAKQPRGLRRARRALLPVEACPACRSRDERSRWLARDLAQLLAEVEFQQAFCASSALCLEHFQLTLSYTSGETRAWLLRAQQSKLSELRARLDDVGDVERKTTTHEALRLLLGTF